MSNHKGVYVFRLRYALISGAVVLAVAALIAYLYLTAVIETRTLETMAEAVEKRIIAIDPGHGGYDPGAIGPAGTREKELTLAVSEKLAKLLSKNGALVVLLRDDDRDFITEGPGTKKKRDLDSRVKLAEEKGAEILVSIHVNSYGTKWSGAQTFFSPENQRSVILAEEIQKELKKTTGTTRESLPTSTCYLLESLEMPSCIVELGFLSNPKEEKKLLDPAYQEKLAEAIYKGIIRYFAQS